MENAQYLVRFVDHNPRFYDDITRPFQLRGQTPEQARSRLQNCDIDESYRTELKLYDPGEQPAAVLEEACQGNPDCIVASPDGFSEGSLDRFLDGLEQLDGQVLCLSDMDRDLFRKRDLQVYRKSDMLRQIAKSIIYRTTGQ